MVLGFGFGFGFGVGVAERSVLRKDCLFTSGVSGSAEGMLFLVPLFGVPHIIGIQKKTIPQNSPTQDRD